MVAGDPPGVVDERSPIGIPFEPMPKTIVTDAIWDQVARLLPKREGRRRGRRRPGRQPTPDRAVLTGILFVLKSGLPWKELPSEMGCGSGMTCLRRLRDWQGRGVWPRIQRVLERGLPNEDFEWSRARTSEPPRQPSTAAPAGSRERRLRSNGGSIGRPTRYG